MSRIVIYEQGKFEQPDQNGLQYWVKEIFSDGSDRLVAVFRLLLDADDYAHAQNHEMGLYDDH